MNFRAFGAGLGAGMFELGQLARCVNDRGWITGDFCGVAGPAFGARVTVVGAARGVDFLEGREADFLVLCDWPGKMFAARYFVPLEAAQMELLRRQAARPSLPARELVEALS